MERWMMKVFKSDKMISDGDMKVLTMLTKKDWQSVTIYTRKSPEILWITTTPPPLSPARPPYILFVEGNYQSQIYPFR